MRKKLIEILSAISGGIGLWVAGKSAYDAAKKLPILGVVVQGFKWLSDMVTSTLNLPLKVWNILLVAILSYGFYLLIRYVRRRMKPDYAKYTQDIFRNWIWKWDWRRVDSVWRVDNLRAYCPNCDVELVDLDILDSTRSKCPEKKEIYVNDDEPKEEIIRLIQAKVDKKCYPKRK